MYELISLTSYVRDANRAQNVVLTSPVRLRANDRLPRGTESRCEVVHHKVENKKNFFSCEHESGVLM